MKASLDGLDEGEQREQRVLDYHSPHTILDLRKRTWSQRAKWFADLTGAGLLVAFLLAIAVRNIWPGALAMLFAASAALAAMLSGILAWDAEPQHRRRAMYGMCSMAIWLLSLYPFSICLHRPTGGSRETANRVKCAGNLRQIGQALGHYAGKHGEYPDSLVSLYLDDPASVPSEWFVCPTPGHRSASGKTSQEVAANLAGKGHPSYVYRGRGMRSPLMPDVVLMYEPMANHWDEGMNVLFGDGHVEFVSRQHAGPVWDAIHGITTRPAR